MTDYSLNEVWAPVPGYEGFYSVSTLGRVRSEDRVSSSRWGPTLYRGQLIRQGIDRYGYQVATLTRSGQKNKTTVHRLVLLAFAGEALGRQACHGDGVKTNNRLDNLRWGSSKENHADRLLHGTDFSGDRNPAAKLTNSETIAIANDPRDRASVAKEYGISLTQLNRIRSGPHRSASFEPNERPPETYLRGEEHQNVKLTDADVLAIILDSRSQKAIAAEYGISQGHVCRLKTGKQRRPLLPK